MSERAASKALVRGGGGRREEGRGKEYGGCASRSTVASKEGRKEGRKGERLSEGKTGVLDSLSIPTLLLTSRKA